MNNEVTFSIRFITENGEVVQKVAMDAKELAQAIDQVSDKASRMNGKLLDVNQCAMAFQNLFSGIQQVSDQLKTMTDMYAQSEIASTKLTTVMRQRMGAQSEDVKSIREVIAAQKDLGVVSGTVQTAGAQQMATFLNQKSSLATLIPAMNNLLVQQEGLNATQENAASIGNMMGKAMQGQTEVLRRVGITFSDAQAKAMKYGTEEERAATLAQVVKDNVGDMNVEASKTDAGKAKKLSMALDSIKMSLGHVMSGIQPVISGMSQIGMAFFAFSQAKLGIEGMTTALHMSWLQTASLAVATKAHGVASAFAASMNRILGVSFFTEAGAAVAATIATKAFTTAITLGIGVALTAIMVALGKLVEWLMSLAGAEDKATQSTEKLDAASQTAKSSEEEYKQKLQETRTELSVYINQLKNFHGSKEKEKSIVDELNSKYGETMGYFSSVSEWYKALTANSQAYCEQMVIEARQRMLANQIADAEQANHDIRYDNSGKLKKYSTERETRDGGWKSAGGAGSYKVSVEVKGTSEVEKMNSAIDKNRANINGWKKQMDDLGKQRVKMPVTGSPTAPTGKTGKTGNGGGNSGGGGNTDTELKLIANAKSYKELGNNIEYYNKKLDNTNGSDEKSIGLYAEKIAKLKAEQEAIKAKEQGAVTKKDASEVTTIEEADAAISYQESLRKKASAGEIADIDATIAAMKKKKTEIEDSGKSDSYDDEKNTYEEINAEISRLTEKIQRSGTTERGELTRTIAMYEKKKAKMEATDASANAPGDVGKMKSLQELDDATEYYRKIAMRAEGDVQTKTEDTLRTIEKKRTVMEQLSKLGEGSAELGELKGLGDKELTIRLKEIGGDAIKKKLQDLNKLMSSPTATKAQKDNIRGQIAEWTKYDAKLKKSEVTFRGTWNSVKGLGNGMKSLTTTVKGNGSAWDKTTGIIDSGIEIFDGIMSIIQIVKALTAATTTEQSAESATQQATNSAEAATWTGLAAAKTAAAYASIPFLGEGLAAAQVVAIKSMVTAAAIPTFANGNIAYGATLGIFGEYANASRNPEITAPLDKLRSMIEPRGLSGEVEFRIKGRNLVGVAKKREKLVGRG